MEYSLWAEGTTRLGSISDTERRGIQIDSALNTVLTSQMAGHRGFTSRYPSPLAQYYPMGYAWLHLVDLTGARGYFSECQ